MTARGSTETSLHLGVCDLIQSVITASSGFGRSASTALRPSPGPGVMDPTVCLQRVPGGWVAAPSVSVLPDPCGRAQRGK